MDILTKEDRLRIAASAEKSFWSDPNLSWHDALIAQAEAAILKKLTEQSMEPVSYEFQCRDGNWYSFINRHHYENTVADGSWPIRKLFDETQLLAAQQRTAEACVKVCKKVQRDNCGEKYDMMGKDLAEQSAEAIRNGEWRMEGISVSDIIKQLRELEKECSRVSDSCTQRTILLAIDEIESLSKQLAEKEVEIKRPKENKEQAAKDFDNAWSTADTSRVTEQKLQEGFNRIKDEWVYVPCARGLFSMTTQPIQPTALVERRFESNVERLHHQLAACQLREQQLREALGWALDWIDAIPKETQLPTMLGFDRDYVNGLVALPQDTSTIESFVEKKRFADTRRN